jgi:hypothetical protein
MIEISALGTIVRTVILTLIEHLVVKAIKRSGGSP